MRGVVREEIESYFKDQGNSFKASWKNGLKFETRDKKVKLDIGGRLFADATFFDDEDVEWYDDWTDGFEFRTARFRMGGTIHSFTKFKMQFDFSDGSVRWKDVYVGLTNLSKCWGCAFPNITLGHFKEPFSLEELTSSRHISFMERALPVTTFAPSRNTGVGLHSALWGDRITVAAGAWTHANDDQGAFDIDGSGYDITGRVTFMPWAPCDCEARFLHIGASFSFQQDLEAVRYRTRPETHLGPRFVDTHSIPAESATLIGAEMAFGYDRWHVQGEYIASMVTSEQADDPTFYGYYAEVGYMLLGGHRPFKRSKATFDRVKPCTNFLGKDCRGFGALALNARYSYVNLNDEDAGIWGGEATDITIGLNWYLNPNFVIKLNYVIADVDYTEAGGPDGTLNIFGIRTQVDF